MRFEDLPAHVQRQIRQGEAVTNAIAGRDPHSAQPQRGLTPLGPPQPRQPRTDRWKCHDCGLRFPAWQTAQNHANEKGHVRVELILPEVP